MTCLVIRSYYVPKTFSLPAVLPRKRNACLLLLGVSPRSFAPFSRRASDEVFVKREKKKRQPLSTNERERSTSRLQRHQLLREDDQKKAKKNPRGNPERQHNPVS